MDPMTILYNFLGVIVVFVTDAIMVNDRMTHFLKSLSMIRCRCLMMTFFRLSQ